nr:transposase (putative), gypsy type [Tanacetum cinerariifolium]
MGRDTIQLENAVSAISQEYLLEFTSEYGIPEGLHPELPGPGETIVDFSEGKVDVYTKFFEFANFRIPISQFLFDILGHYQIHLSQLSVIGAAKVSHFEINYRVLNIVPTLNLFRLFYIPSFNSGWMSFSKRQRKKYPTVLYKTPGRLEKLEQSIFLGGRKDISHHRGLAYKRSEGWDANSELVFRGRRDSTGHTPYPHPKTTRSLIMPSRAGSEILSRGRPPNNYSGGGAEDRVQDEVAYEIPPTGNASAMGVALETGLEKKVGAMGPHVNKRRRKRGNNQVETNAPPQVLKRNHDAFYPAQSTHRGKSIASIGLDTGPFLSTPAAQDPFTATKSMSDPEPLSYVNPLPHPEQHISQSSNATATEIPTEDAATAGFNVQFFVGSPESGRSSSVSFMVGSPSSIYQPGWGVTNDCRLDTSDACQDIVDRIAPPGYFYEPRHFPNADFLGQYNITLARHVAMGSQLRLRFKQEVRLLKKARSKIARQNQRIQVKEEEIKKLDQEMHGLQNQTKNLKTLLEAEVDMKKAAEAKHAKLAKELDSLRAAFEEFNKYEDDKVEQRCAEMDARMDKLSADFDEELYPHMLTAIVGRRWVIRHDLRLAVMKCVESSEIRQAFTDASDTGEDAPKWMRDLRLSSSQLKIPVYPEGRDPEDLWAVKEEVLLKDAIAANISQAEKKKKCRVVCRTHGIGSAYHVRSDGIPVSAPTVS